MEGIARVHGVRSTWIRLGDKLVLLSAVDQALKERTRTRAAA